MTTPATPFISLDLLREALPIQRRVVHAGDALYQAGERFTNLHVLNSGMVKIGAASFRVSPDRSTRS